MVIPALIKMRLEMCDELSGSEWFDYSVRRVKRSIILAPLFSNTVLERFFHVICMPKNI